MRTTRVVAVAAMVLVALVACGPKPAPAPTQPAATQAAPPQTTAPTNAAATNPPAQTALDPCQLVTQVEASALTGASYGPGKREDTDGGKFCWYGANTHNVLEVGVAEAKTVEEARGYKDQMKAQLQAGLQGAPITMTPLSGVGDDAVTISGQLPKVNISVSGIYILKGKIGFMIVDETNGTAPTTAAIKAAAETSLSRLP
jgi:uncharacterized protein DUF3558